MSDEIRKSEAKGEPAVVEFRGHKFTVAREMDDWSVDLLESIEEGKSVGIVRGALGPWQWDVVRSMHLKVRDLNELAQGITSALGFGEPGNSSASSA